MSNCWLGTPIGGFLLLELMGKGGMGAVYEAENIRIHRKVAIKVLHAGVAETAPFQVSGWSADADRPGSFEATIRQAVYMSATPGPFELERSERIAEQLIRPTGIVGEVLTEEKV